MAFLWLKIKFLEKKWNAHHDSMVKILHICHISLGGQDPFKVTVESTFQGTDSPCYGRSNCWGCDWLWLILQWMDYFFFTLLYIYTSSLTFHISFILCGDSIFRFTLNSAFKAQIYHTHSAKSIQAQNVTSIKNLILYKNLVFFYHVPLYFINNRLAFVEQFHPDRSEFSKVITFKRFIIKVIKG